MVFNFLLGNFIVPCLPSISHPMIYFLYSHVPSPLLNLVPAIGSFPLWPVITGIENIECIPWSMAQEICFKFAKLKLLVMAIKLSTYTSSKIMIVWGKAFLLSCLVVWIIMSSNLCWGRSLLFICCIMSCEVTDLEQKNGGISHQPISKLFGITISISSFGNFFKMTAGCNRSSMCCNYWRPYTKIRPLHLIL